MVLITVSKIMNCERLMRNPVRLLIVRNWHKEPIKVTWEKPEIGWTKLNYDGSCKCKTGKSSIGGILRNHNAEFLLGYAEPIGRTTSTVAELAALRRGLELVLENGWNDVWLEGDSKSLVEMIAKRKVNVVRSEAEIHVREINVMILELNKCMVTHVYREGNRAADKFAQLGHHLKTPHVWRNVPPGEVLRVMHQEAEGKVFLRRR
ncbi:unnamed protein product [Thlaspi arvense]|uniref:RNase H type-1 domain-containing protein n=1 Tax=Thlaspi arvense TaxID=13288 RepID=A0AAU9RG32_THLAR|nr:unnamed protein product [Thlaspi arvense]